MSVKKWILVFFASLLGFAALLALFNAAVDPFGVFGDRLMQWYAYDMTQNPRVAKSRGLSSTIRITTPM